MYKHFDIDMCYYLPSPSYYNENNIEYIIISTDYSECRIKPGIYKYGIKNNTFELLYEYPSKFQPQFHGQVLDKRNSKLYLIEDSTCSNDPLIIGYIKELENNNIVPNIPIVIKKLILNYFPWF